MLCRVKNVSQLNYEIHCQTNKSYTPFKTIGGLVKAFLKQNP